MADNSASCCHACRKPSCLSCRCLQLMYCCTKHWSPKYSMFATVSTISCATSICLSPYQHLYACLTQGAVQQVVVAPHIYPPSISKATQAYDGDALFSRLSKSFGTLNKQGYCLSSGNCHQFAIAIGETGTAFTNALDTPAMADFANYLTNTGLWPVLSVLMHCLLHTC